MKIFKNLKIREVLQKNKFAENVTILVGGTAGSQIIATLAIPILTRLYTPEDFGILAIYISILTIIGVVSALRYEMAIPLPEDEKVAANIAILSIIIVMIMTIVSAIAFYIFKLQVAKFFETPNLEEYYWTLPVGIAAVGIFNILNYWAIRKKQFQSIALAKLSQTTTSILIQLSAYSLGGITLLVAQFIGQLSSSVFLARIVFKSNPFKNISRDNILKAAIRYKNFPIFSSAEGFANSVGAQLPSVILAAAFGTPAAGYYILAQKTLSMPMSLVGRAVSQVFYSEISHARRTGELGDLIVQLQKNLTSLGAPPAVILFLFGPEIFIMFFGNQWSDAGFLAKWMSPLLYFQFISSPLSVIFPATDNQRHGLIFQIILVIVRILALGCGIYFDDLLIAIILYSFTSSICYFGLLIWVTLLAKASLKEIFKFIIHSLSVVMIFTVPIHLVLVNNKNTFTNVICAAITTIVTMYYYYKILIPKLK